MKTGDDREMIRTFLAVEKSEKSKDPIMFLA